MLTLKRFGNLGWPDSFGGSESIAAGDAAPASRLQTGVGGGGGHIEDRRCHPGDRSYHFYFEEFPLPLGKSNYGCKTVGS